MAAPRGMAEGPHSPWALADKIRLLEQFPHLKSGGQPVVARGDASPTAMPQKISVKEHRARMADRAKLLVSRFAQLLRGMDLQYLGPDGAELKAAHDKIRALGGSITYASSAHPRGREDIDDVPTAGDTAARGFSPALTPPTRGGAGARHMTSPAGPDGYRGTDFGGFSPSPPHGHRKRDSEGARNGGGVDDSVFMTPDSESIDVPRRGGGRGGGRKRSHGADPTTPGLGHARRGGGRGRLGGGGGLSRQSSWSPPTADRMIRPRRLSSDDEFEDWGLDDSLNAPSRGGGSRRGGRRKSRRSRGSKRGSEAAQGVSDGSSTSWSSLSSYSEKSYDEDEQDGALEQLRDLVDIREDQVANAKLALREEVRLYRAGKSRTPTRDLVSEYKHNRHPRPGAQGPPSPRAYGGGEPTPPLGDDDGGSSASSFDPEPSTMSHTLLAELPDLDANTSMTPGLSSSLAPPMHAAVLGPAPVHTADREVLVAATGNIFRKLVNRGHQASQKVQSKQAEEAKHVEEAKQETMMDAIRKEESKLTDPYAKELHALRMLGMLFRAEYEKLQRRYNECEGSIRRIGASVTTEHRERLIIPEGLIGPTCPGYDALGGPEKERRLLRLGLAVAGEEAAIQQLKTEGKYQNLNVVHEQIRIAEERLERLWMDQQAQLDRNSVHRSQLTKVKYALQELEDDRIATLVAGYKVQIERDSKARKAHVGTQCQIEVMNDFVELRARALARQEQLLRREVGNYEAIVTNIDRFNAVTETELCCRECLTILKEPYMLVPCGHSVCAACVGGVMAQGEPVCPECASILTDKPVRNTRLEAILSRWQGAGAGAEGEEDPWEVLTEAYGAMKRIRETLTKWAPAPYGIFLPDNPSTAAASPDAQPQAANLSAAVDQVLAARRQQQPTES